MPTELPIACSLTATDLRARLAEMRELGADGLLDVDRRGSDAVLRFRRSDANRTRLAAVVAAEAECCAFLDLRLSEDNCALVLRIIAPAGAEAVVDDLIGAFAGAGRRA